MKKYFCKKRKKLLIFFSVCATIYRAILNFNAECCLHSALSYDFSVGGVNMAKCAYCGKGVTFGHNVSHSNRKTSRTWKPNIRKVKVVDGGTHKTVAICSRCLRANKVERA